MDEEKIKKAAALFKEGYNCSQSVVAAFECASKAYAIMDYTHDIEVMRYCYV